MPQGVPDLPQDALIGGSFSVEIDSVSIAQYQEVSGLVSEIEAVDLKENDGKGRPVLKRAIGPRKMPTLTLKRAANSSKDLWDWHQAALDGKLAGARRNGSIVQYDFTYTEVARYNFTNAWVSKLELSGLKAGDTNPAQESVTIVCETLVRVK